MYQLILHLHGVYVAYSFLKYMFSNTCYYCNYVYEYIFPPPSMYKQIKDK